MHILPFTALFEKCFEFYKIFQFTSLDAHGLLFKFQVKRYNGFNSTWNSGLTFKESFLTSSVKGQHGLELLLEINKSMFTSEAFGCICVGTYVRFIFISYVLATYLYKQSTTTKIKRRLKGC